MPIDKIFFEITQDYEHTISFMLTRGDYRFSTVFRKFSSEIEVFKLINEHYCR